MMEPNSQADALVQRIASRLLKRQWMLATAESCTGGGVGYRLTQVPGSSAWYQGGVISYSNFLKQRVLQVPEALILSHGAVSEAVASAMAEGAARCLQADIGLSTSGIAGPDGGTDDKPVGTVCFGWSIQGHLFSDQKIFAGDREAVRQQSIEYALKFLLQRL